MNVKKPYDKSVYQSLTLVFQFGINMLVPICMMLWLGIKLDEHFNTGWITIIFFFMGAAAGFTNIVKMARGVYGKHRKNETGIENDGQNQED